MPNDSAELRLREFVEILARGARRVLDARRAEREASTHTEFGETPNPSCVNRSTTQ